MGQLDVRTAIIAALLMGLALLAAFAAHAETDVILMGKAWHFGHETTPRPAKPGAT